MKCKVLFFTFLLISNSFYAQNLVPNPSFEVYDTCPDNTNQVSQAIGWMNFGNTPDFFHSCSTNLVGVPQNAVGFQNPASGSGMCGLIPYAFTPNYREFIAIQLLSPLQSGTKYYVSFKINYCNSPLYYNCVATNRVGARFSNNIYSEFSTAPVDNIAHVFSDSIIIDTLGWFEVFGSYTVNSNFNYIMIGNFFDDDNTGITNECGLNQNSYYYVDDICVSPDSVLAHNYIYTGSEDENPNENIVVFPNPAREMVQVEIPEQWHNQRGMVQMYNSIGALVYEQAQPLNQILTIPLQDMPQGIYLLNIRCGTERGSTKLVVE